MTKYAMYRCAVAFVAALVAWPAMAYTGKELAKYSKIDIAQARRIALKAHPGTIVDEELERESGGSGLRYSFDIKSGSITQEVGVDAKTGTFLRTRKKAKIQTERAAEFVSRRSAASIR